MTSQDPAGSAPVGPRKRIEVAAAVLHDSAGRFLLAQRPSGKAFEGYWEFPGGKVETGETAKAAMCRELQEELGIDVDEDAVCPWLTRDFDYPHASVRLRFFRIYRWRGELRGREGQRFAWQSASALNVSPILPANGPILRALELPDCYGITQAEALGMDQFKRRLESALRQGLKLIQVREKNMVPAQLRTFASQVVTLAHQHGARVLINGDAELAAETHADGIHLTALQLASLKKRPACDWVAASCHDREEVEAAVRMGLDFAVVGPVMATPTHPDAQTLGWKGLAACIADTSIPVYALGGLQPADMETARRCGAHGVAMLRGAWR